MCVVRKPVPLRSLCRNGIRHRAGKVVITTILGEFLLGCLAVALVVVVGLVQVVVILVEEIGLYVDEVLVVAVGVKVIC